MTEKVVRYEITGIKGATGAHRSNTGEWIAYSDYEAAIQELKDQILAERNAFAARVEELEAHQKHDLFYWEKDRAENQRLRDFILRLERARGCWCEAGIGNPNMRGHSPVCRDIQAAFKETE